MTTHRCPHCGEVIEVHARVMATDGRKYDHEQALALLRFGATAREVADTFGVSRQTIYGLKRRNDGAVLPSPP